MSDNGKVFVSGIVECYKSSKRAIDYLGKEYGKTTARAKKKRAKLEDDIAHQVSLFTGACVLLNSFIENEKFDIDYERTLKLLFDRMGLE